MINGGYCIINVAGFDADFSSSTTYSTTIANTYNDFIEAINTHKRVVISGIKVAGSVLSDFEPINLYTDLDGNIWFTHKGVRIKITSENVVTAEMVYLPAEIDYDSLVEALIECGIVAGKESE